MAVPIGKATEAFVGIVSVAVDPLVKIICFPWSLNAAV
jgi:hypothetical protein